MNREDLIYRTNNYIYNFQKFELIRSFAKNICEGKITLENADNEQASLLLEIDDFKKETKSKHFFNNKKQRRDTLHSLNTLYEVREKLLKCF